MRIIVTGSRDFTDREVVEAALTGIGIDGLTVVHGNCPSGADQFADNWIIEHGVTVERYPADWKMGKQAGHWRNQHMVNLGADGVFAFIKADAANRGTLDCVRRAEEAGIPIIFFVS